MRLARAAVSELSGILAMNIRILLLRGEGLEEIYSKKSLQVEE